MTLHDRRGNGRTARSASSPRLTRRSFLGAAGALSATALLAACGGSGGGTAQASELDIYSWANYFAQDNLAGFTSATGITPKISTYDSNDTLSAKLNSPASTGFDLVIPTSGLISQYASRGLIQKIDQGRLDLSALDPALLNREYDPHNQYSIPKDWGFSAPSTTRGRWAGTSRRGRTSSTPVNAPVCRARSGWPPRDGRTWRSHCGPMVRTGTPLISR